MTTPYNPLNWYWYVAGDKTKAFSSASGDYVTPDNAVFQAWVAAGGVPTNIDTEDSLGNVLAQASVRPKAARVLDGYLNSQTDAMVVKVPAKVLANIINRLQVLEGKQPFTAAQFKTFVKGIL